MRGSRARPLPKEALKKLTRSPFHANNRNAAQGEEPVLDDLQNEAVALGDDKRLHEILREVCVLTGMGFAAVARVTEHRWIACQVLDKIDFGLDPGDELKSARRSATRSGTAAKVSCSMTPAMTSNGHATPCLSSMVSRAIAPSPSTSMMGLSSARSARLIRSDGRSATKRLS